MSGGVDSSLTAALLVEHGYDVTGVYMKNWSRDLPGMKCPWAEDLADAKRVAVQLGIDFKVFDFENEYKQKVVDYMIDEYRNGRTPNPDIMCNQEVKFKLFLEAAISDGADLIATGHYARVAYTDDSVIVNSERLHAGFDKGPGALSNSGSRCSELAIADSSACDVRNESLEQKKECMTAHSSKELSNAFCKHLEPESIKAPGPLIDPERSRLKKVLDNSCRKGNLLQAVDANKDQTYFLYRVTGGALGRTLFPIGEYDKPTVRKMAAERGLTTASKKDSQGICFVGQVGIREFLSQYVEQVPGKIIDKISGKVLGSHDGAIFYTLGQRHGLDVGGGLPYYVAGKDMQSNEVYVTTNLNDETLWKKTITLGNVHWINDAPVAGKYQIRSRHRAPLVDADLSFSDNDEVILRIQDPQRAIAVGQSVVIYDNEICLGGGIIV